MEKKKELSFKINAGTLIIVGGMAGLVLYSAGFNKGYERADCEWAKLLAKKMLKS